MCFRFTQLLWVVASFQGRVRFKVFCCCCRLLYVVSVVLSLSSCIRLFGIFWLILIVSVLFYVVSVALGGVKMVLNSFGNLLILQVDFMLCVSLIDILNAFK